MADQLESGGHVMSKTVVDNLILAVGISPNLPLNSDM
jgi:hypothetical protein